MDEKNHVLVAPWKTIWRPFGALPGSSNLLTREGYKSCDRVKVGIWAILWHVRLTRYLVMNVNKCSSKQFKSELRCLQ